MQLPGMARSARVVLLRSNHVIRASATTSLSTTSSCHNIIRSAVPEIVLPSGNLASYVLKDSHKWADKTAAECTATGRAYTYAQMVDRVARWGGVLTKLGLKKGDVLAIMMFNCPEYPIVTLGAVSIGVSVSFINTIYTVEEIHRQLVNSEPKVVVSDTSLEDKVEAALLLYKKPTPVVINGPSSISGAYNLRQILEDRTIAFADPVEVCGKDRAFMPYSSGTTGHPKGVVLSHDAVSSNIAMISHPYNFLHRETTESHQDTFLGYLPFFHIYGSVLIMLMGLRKGIKIGTIQHFDPNTFVSLIGQHKVRIIHTVPTVLNFLVQSPLATPKSMETVDNCICGAAPVPLTTAVALKEKVRKPLFFQEGFGMTEILVTNITPVDQEKVGSCGPVISNVQAKVVDLTTGDMLPAHQDGEICMKTPSIMTEYYKNPEATAQTIDDEGWLHTGDVGHYDEKGFFTIVDRTKDLIKVKALQVSPSELEDLILQHPKVVEVSVVGVPDERMGEVPRAYIVPSGSLKEADVVEFLEERVAPHKKLAGGVVFLKEIPKNSTGKPLRRELRNMAL